MVKEDTTKLIPIKKVLHCPFCQERSAGFIYSVALAEAHSDGRRNCKQGHTIGSVDSDSGIVGSSFLYIILSQIGVLLWLQVP
jgi:hypothetical protein